MLNRIFISFRTCLTILIGVGGSLLLLAGCTQKSNHTTKVTVARRSYNQS